MSKRISPAQRLQAEIDEVFAGGEDLAGAIEQVAVLGARLLLQTAVEAEVDVSGRARYQRKLPSVRMPGRAVVTASASRRSRPRPGR